MQFSYELWILYTSKHCEFEIGKIAAHTLKSDITQLYNSLLTYSQNVYIKRTNCLIIKYTHIENQGKSAIRSILYYSLRHIGKVKG